MPTKDELNQLRLIGQQERYEREDSFAEERRLGFVEKLGTVMQKLDMRLRVAAQLGFLELKLIRVTSPGLIDLESVVRLDASRRSISGSPWKTVHPYQDKSVLRHPGLITLWERLESYGLRPIFIEGGHGAPILGVQLPDGGTYPRNDSAAIVAQRTANRLDEFLEEGGYFSFTPASTTKLKPLPEGGC